MATLDDALKEAYAIAPANVVIYHTLEIQQQGVQSSRYIVQNVTSIMATDENGVGHVFDPVGFAFSLPAQTEDGFRTLTLAIDNVNREVMDFIETAQTSQVPVKLIYRPYLSTDTSHPMMNPPYVFYLRDVRITPGQITGRATFMDLANLKFPSELYQRERFPALG